MIGHVEALSQVMIKLAGISSCVVVSFTLSFTRIENLSWPSFLWERTITDIPVVTSGFGGLWFSDCPLSGLSTGTSWSLLCRLLLVHGPPPLRGAADWRVLCGHGGFRPAGGQFPVVLVIYIQQLPWTGAQTEGMDGRWEDRLDVNQTFRPHYVW